MSRAQVSPTARSICESCKANDDVPAMSQLSGGFGPGTGGKVATPAARTDEPHAGCCLACPEQWNSFNVATQAGRGLRVGRGRKRGGRAEGLRWPLPELDGPHKQFAHCATTTACAQAMPGKYQHRRRISRWSSNTCCTPLTASTRTVSSC